MTLALAASCSSVTRVETLAVDVLDDSAAAPATPTTGGTEDGPDQGSSEGAEVNPGDEGSVPVEGSEGVSPHATATTSPRVPCSRPFRVGASFASDLGAGLASLGHPDAAAQLGAAQEAARQLYRLAAEDMNRRGGMNGCPIELVFHDFRATAAEGWDSQSQQECTKFTQDDPVDVVFTGAQESRVLLECLHQARVPVRMTYFNTDSVDFERYPGTLLGHDTLAISRLDSFIELYDAAGYFDPGAKVGILVGDDGSGAVPRLIRDHWGPELEKRGMTPEVFEYRVVTGAGDLGRVSSLFAQAVLRFKGDGITHVLVPPDQLNAVVLFMHVAETQEFRPRYGLTSQSGIFGWFSVPPRQRDRAVGISYRLADLTDNRAALADVPSSEGRRWCEDVYDGAGVDAQYPWCDFLLHLEAAGAGPDFSPDALRRGTEALGSSYLSASGYGATHFGPGRHDGLSEARALAWDARRNAWVGAGPVTRIP